MFHSTLNVAKPSEPNAAPTILVVDDQPSCLETVEALLANDRYDLEFAGGGQEAMAWLTRSPVDLILCDVMMPGVDGYEVCRAVKSHTAWRFTPVILLTVLDGADDMVRGLDAGADEFLSKPVDKVALRARVRTMLRIRSQYKALDGSRLDLDELIRARRERLISEAGLTSREKEVLELLLLARSTDEIGVALGIASRTVKYHQSRLLRKLGAESKMDLLRVLL